MKKNEFLDAIQSLKLYRRAELVDDRGRRLINELYVDPLPDDHILNTILQPHSTFLVGRKGTGKSTIFQRAQEELNKKPDSTWAYIDIKTLFESSFADLSPLTNIAETSDSLSKEVVERLLLFRRFLIELVKEIKNQINTRINTSLKSRISSYFTGTTAELFENLDSFIDDLSDVDFFNITSMITVDKDEKESEKETGEIKSELSTKLGTSISVEAKLIAELISELSKASEKKYSEAFIRIFNVREIIIRLKEILSELRLRHLYIFIDDFSELPLTSMEAVVDSVLVPFNNWSDEFIKLKVAVYPGRLYLGDIDRSKIDEVYLDIFKAYGGTDVSQMENKAIDFTKRLVDQRINHYCSDPIDSYFDNSDEEQLWRVLFYSSMANPRILGYILFYCYETNILYNNKIYISTIQNAARRYYEEKIKFYFSLNKFLHETFDERSSIYSLKELLEQIVKRAKELRSYRESTVMKQIHGRPPTSHFHVLSDYDPILSTLELNFFLTKYYQMKDRDGNKVSVYALNYGLCHQQAISFGRPREKREHRLYFIERIFDYSIIISSYIKMNQEISCENCNEKYGYDQLSILQVYDMLCPKCKAGKCKVVNLSKKYERVLKEIDPENLLPQTELGILKTLHDDRNKMFAKQIASELDCSYQLVGKRGKKLSDKMLVLRSRNERGRREFEISDTAQNIYFQETPEDDLNFGDDDKELDVEQPHSQGRS